MVVLEHIQDGLPEQLQVVLRKAGGFTGQIGGNIALGAVQGIGYDVFAAHFGALLFGVGLRGDGHTGDGDFLGNDGVNGAGEVQLHRAAHLAAVQCAFHKGGHHGAEGADVVKVGAHEIPQLLIDARVGLFCGLQVAGYADCG